MKFPLRLSSYELPKGNWLIWNSLWCLGKQKGFASNSRHHAYVIFLENGELPDLSYVLSPFGERQCRCSALLLFQAPHNLLALYFLLSLEPLCIFPFIEASCVLHYLVANQKSLAYFLWNSLWCKMLRWMSILHWLHLVVLFVQMPARKTHNWQATAMSPLVFYYVFVRLAFHTVT